jgi:hypothetical protein
LAQHATDFTVQSLEFTAIAHGQAGGLAELVICPVVAESYETRGQATLD